MIPEMIVIAFVVGAVCGAIGLALALRRVVAQAAANAQWEYSAAQWDYLELCLRGRNWRFVTPQTILNLLPEWIGEAARQPQGD